MRLIDADRLLEKLRGNVLVNVTPEIEKTISEMPTIEPERGEWIIKSDEYDFARGHACSECGYGLGCIRSNPPKFCENCGADMRGEKNV